MIRGNKVVRLILIFTLIMGVSSLVVMLERLAAYNEGMTVYETLNNLMRERKAKAALIGETKENTTRTATL